jgi:hypothetical protein
MARFPGQLNEDAVALNFPRGALVPSCEWSLTLLVLLRLGPAWLRSWTEKAQSRRRRHHDPRRRTYP